MHDPHITTQANHIVGAQVSHIRPFESPITLGFDGQVNLFIGPNRVGKSTILRFLSDYAAKNQVGATIFIAPTRVHFDVLIEPTGHPSIGLSIVRLFLGVAVIVVMALMWLLFAVVISNPGGDATIDPIWVGVYLSALTGLGTLWVYTRRQTILLDLKKFKRRSKREQLNDTLAEYDYRIFTSTKFTYAMSLLHQMDERAHDEIMEVINNCCETVFAGIEFPHGIPISHESSGTQGLFSIIMCTALEMAYGHQFAHGWQHKPSILFIDEIENQLHPTWQRRVIPALLEHFPGLQIFSTTHSPFVVAGLKAGQVHLLNRDENGVITATTNEHDIIGWTTDEILRTFMCVDQPTDQLTADRSIRLRELRGKESLSQAEADEMKELRRQVNEDFLSSSTPLEAQRERYGDMMLEFLRSRQSDLSRDGN